MKALILLNIQNDFTAKGGTLYVNKSEEIVPVINRLLISDKFHCIATQQYKPLSLVQKGDKKELINHCVAGTDGALFHKNLLTGKVRAVFRIGTNDSGCAFFEQNKATGLAGYLKERELNDLYFAGVPSDFLLSSAVSALNLGFKTNIILDGTKGIDQHEIEKQKEFGVINVIGKGDELLK